MGEPAGPLSIRTAVVTRFGPFERTPSFLPKREEGGGFARPSSPVRANETDPATGRHPLPPPRSRIRPCSGVASPASSASGRPPDARAHRLHTV